MRNRLLCTALLVFSQVSFAAAARPAADATEAALKHFDQNKFGIFIH